MAKHLLDETAEFRLPRLPRHAAEGDDELDATQRFDPGFRHQRPAPVPPRESDQR